MGVWGACMSGYGVLLMYEVGIIMLHVRVLGVTVVWGGGLTCGGTGSRV